MLIQLVRDSVLQCFCHSCKAAPLLTHYAAAAESPKKGGDAAAAAAAPKKKANGKGKFRTKQSKKVQLITTEIRCQEQTKGGLKYEVILAEPTVQPPAVATTPTALAVDKSTAVEKLKAAEERRCSLEKQKGESWSLKMSKIEEVTKKRNEMSAAFIESTRKALDAKMHLSEEKRDAHINEIKTKLKEHLESVEKARVAVEQQTEEMSNALRQEKLNAALQEKLNTASSNRDENIKKMQERLKEHTEQVARTKQSTAVKVQQLELQIQEKLDQARERRELIEREQKAKLLQHDKRIQMVRQNKAARDSQGHNEDDNELDESKANETASSG